MADVDMLLRAAMADAPPPMIPHAIGPRAAADATDRDEIFAKLSSWQKELQEALRKELPLALEKELPRALSGCIMSSPMAEGHLPADESLNEVHPLRDMSSQDTEKYEEINLNAANTYAATKYFNEFGVADRTSTVRRSLSSKAAAEELTDVADDEEGKPSKSSSMASQDLRKNQVTQMVSVGGPQHQKEQKRRKNAATLQHIGQAQLLALSIMDHPFFEVVTLGLIILNAIAIGVQTDWMAQSGRLEVPLAFQVIDVCFCVAFSVELGIRIFAQRSSFFRQDWQWNMFDFTLVALQITELILELSASDGASNAGPNMSFMRILRILRLVRVMRLVRVVRHIRELRTIIASVFNSLKALCWTILLIGLLVYVMSIALTQLVADYTNPEGEAPGEAELLDHFGSIPWSALVLFQMVTNGVDWADVGTPLINYISPLIAPVLCLYVAFTQFAMLNVITGVFVESALESDLDEKDCTMVGRLMDFLSGSSSPGQMSWTEFEDRLDDPTIQLYFKSVDLDPREARSLFLLLDTDRTGSVDAEEFIMGCLRLRGSAKAIDLATLMYESRRWFRQVDKRLRTVEHNTLVGKKALASRPQGIMREPASPLSVKSAIFHTS